MGKIRAFLIRICGHFMIIIVLVLSVPCKISQAAQKSSQPSQQNPNEKKSNLTLSDCYQLALKQSEKVAIQVELIKEAEGRFMQYINRVFPQAYFSYSDQRQNGSNSSSFTLRDIPERKFVFSQSIFSGFKEIATVMANRAEKRQREQELVRARQLLYTDVADAFYFLLSYQDDVDALKITQNALTARVEDLKKREELGRSRPSEVAGAEAKLRRSEADLESLLSEKEVAQELLEFLVGTSVESLMDPEPNQISLNPIETYLDNAFNRSDVLAAQEAFNGAKKQMVVARSGFYPTVNMTGDYYLKRTGASEGVNWDAKLTIEVPITKTGETIGKVKEFSAKLREAKLTLNQSKRNAVLEIKNAYAQLASSLRQVESLEKALSASEKNYKLQQDDYGRSLVNNLDVLQALEDLQDVRRDYIAAKYDVKRLYAKLQVAAGEIHE